MKLMRPKLRFMHTADASQVRARVNSRKATEDCTGVEAVLDSGLRSMFADRLSPEQ